MGLVALALFAYPNTVNSDGPGGHGKPPGLPGHGPAALDADHQLGRETPSGVLNHVVSCGNSFTWLDSAVDIYWGGYTVCSSWVDVIQNQAWLYFNWAGTWVVIDVGPYNECFNVSMCFSEKWAGFQIPGDYLIEYCHSIFHHTPVNWHCHWAAFSAQ